MQSFMAKSAASMMAAVCGAAAFIPAHATLGQPTEPRNVATPVATATPSTADTGQKLPDLSTTPTLFVVAYAHLDTQWRWCYPQVIREFLPATLHDNFHLFDKYPHYTFNFSGSRRYQMMEEYYPEEYARLKREVAAGRWFTCGSSVDENDANVPSAESYVRHMLYGNRFFRREFGIASDEYMLPDCFGFPAAIPSLLAHCGVKQFSTQKLTWNAVVPIPFKVGVWEGPDGHSVVAALDPGSYGGEVLENLAHSEGWKKRIEANGKVSGVLADFHYYGTGDQGGAPTEKSVAMMEASVTTTDGIKIMAGPADELVKAITSRERDKLPKYKGELQLTEHSAGSITSEAYMKRWNRKNELLADGAERASVAAMWLGGRDYPAATLENAWTLVLGSQMHDILPGTSLPRAYDYAWNDELLAGNEFAAVLQDATGIVASQLDTRGNGVPLVVYNPLSVERQDVVEADIPGDINATPGLAVTGPGGSSVPAQVLSSEGGIVRIAFIANVPSVGFATYHAVLSDYAPVMAQTLHADKSGLENDHYRVKLNDHGDVVSIHDKKANRELLSAPATLGLHYENPRHWPAWNQDWADRQLPVKEVVGGTPTIRVLEDGFARVCLEVVRELGSSTFTQRIRLAGGSAGDRVEFDCTIDWAARERSLRATFPLTVSNPAATYDIQTGTIERGNGKPKQYEYAFQQWFDLTDAKGDYGVTVMSDSKYGADKPSDGTVRLTLLHTPGTHGGYQDQGTQDIGRHHIQYAIAGHQGDWRQELSAVNAARLNQPLLAFRATPHAGPLGKSFSMVQVSDPNVRIAAMKKAEDGNEVILRLRELSGHPLKAIKITAGKHLVAAREVDGQERPIGAATVQDGALITDIGGYELRAFAVKLGDAPAKATPSRCVPIALDFDTDVVATRAKRGDGSMNAKGDAYPAEQFPAGVSAQDAQFILGPTADGVLNALAARGQEITLPPGDFNRVYLLAASSDGDIAASLEIDGKPISVKFQDWSGMIGQWDRRLWAGDVPELAFNWTNDLAGIEPGYVKPAPVAWYASHYSTLKGDAFYQYCYMYKVGIDVPSGAKSIRLPENTSIKIFAASAVHDGGNRVAAATPLYDTLAGHVQDAPRVVFDPTKLNDATEVRIEPRLYWKAGDIRYTLDGSTPNAESPVYTRQLLLSNAASLTATILNPAGKPGPTASARIDVNDVTAPSIRGVAALFHEPTLKVSFSEPLDPGSVTAKSFATQPAMDIKSVALSPDSRVAIITLTAAPETDTPYTLNITGLKDASPAHNQMNPTAIDFVANGPVYTLATISKDQYGKPIKDAANLPVKASDSWTMNMFVKAETQPANRTVIAGFGKCEDGNDGVARYMTKFANGLQFWSANRDVPTESPLDLGRWQMLTAAYDGHTLRVYKDATQIGARKVQLSDDEPIINIAPTDPWEHKRTFEGEIRGLTIWNSTLSPDALKSLLEADRGH